MFVENNLMTLNPAPRLNLWEHFGAISPDGPLGLHCMETHADNFSRCSQILSMATAFLFQDMGNVFQN